MPAPLTVGERAPDFVLRDQNGQDVALADYAGTKHVLLVFYPFAFSGICAGELSEIRDDLGRFESDEVQVLCLSCDPVYSQRAWADAQGYFFPLLSDFWPHGAVSTAYGVFDKEHGMAVRGTFLIDPDGVVRWALVNEPGERRDFAGYHQALAEASAAAAKS